MKNRVLTLDSFGIGGVDGSANVVGAFGKPVLKKIMEQVADLAARVGADKVVLRGARVTGARAGKVGKGVQTFRNEYRVVAGPKGLRLRKGKSEYRTAANEPKPEGTPGVPDA